MRSRIDLAARQGLRWTSWLGVLAGAAIAAGCAGGRADEDPALRGRNGASALAERAAAASDTPGVVIGDPIVAPDRTWTWVDFPDSRCDDGSTTGIAVNTSSTSNNLVVFLMGGGACWDYLTCYVLNLAGHGPFQRPQFDAARGMLNGSLFDRTAAQNPFRGWNQVFVPYCTGDVHGGNNVMVYSGRTHHHEGRVNMNAFLGRLAATFPAPDRLVVSGSSAGGFGAAFNYSLFRTVWPSGQVYLIDDSGPVLQGDAIPPAFRDAWFASWRIDQVIDPLCGGLACRADLSLAVPALAALYPNDRFALLSSLQDQTIRGYFLLTPEAFEAALLSLAQNVIDPLPNFRYFITSGQRHTMLGSPASHASAGTPLYDWLRQEVEDDPAWSSILP